MNKTLKRLLLFIPVLLLCAAAGLALSYYMGGKGEFDIAKLSQSSYFLLPVVVGGGLYAIYFLNKLGTDKPKEVKTGSKTKEGKELAQFFDSRWVTEKELKTEKKFMYTTWRDLHTSNDGILLRSEVSGNNLLINMYKPIHALIIGTTGTGKTQKFIEPTIQIMSSTKSKPSFVIADPKGELYEKNCHKLKAEGYDVKVFNLRVPFSSNRWNPLDNAYMLYHKAFTLHNDVKTHVGVNPADLGLKIIANEYNNEWYEYDGVAYPYKEILDQDLESKKNELIDRAENDLREIANILCPIKAQNDRTWEQGAQSFIYGTLLAMLEDSLDPRLNMTREKFNFYNLTRIATYKDPDPENPYKTLRAYYTGRSEYSKVLPLVSGAINNAPGTTKSFMGIVSASLSIFNDSGMCYATSLNEMEFDSFADRPTALFIVYPEEKESRHGIVTMMVSQLYNKLVDLANGYKNMQLPRAVYFLLDEFANLPKIEKIDSMITVSRSRNIFFALVIQSYSQLNAKYGDDIAETVKGNCPIKIFIGTDDAKTCEEFSKLCGNITLQTTSTSESKQKDDKGKDSPNKTTSFSATSRPLIYPDELGHLGSQGGTGEIIVKILNEFPIKVKSTFAYATPMFDKMKASSTYVPAKPLDETKVAYNIATRNSIVLKPKNTIDIDDF